MTDAVLIARFDRAVAVIEAAPSARKVRKARSRLAAAVRDLSLDAYVARLNRDADVFALMGADKWRAQGVTTAAELAAILSAECRRNREKEWREDWD